MLNKVKLRLFTKAVILKVKAGGELDKIINAYTALDTAEKKQLKEAVEKELQED